MILLSALKERGKRVESKGELTKLKKDPLVASKEVYPEKGHYF